MQFDDYIKGSEKSLSEVKLKILSILWDAGNSLPRPWVTSSYLLAQTGQKYFDRRVRELRDELGFDIETSHVDGEHSYRIKSLELSAVNPRYYLTSTQKSRLFRDVKNTCQACGKIISAGVRGLQADHKVPLSRGGSQEYENWQALCNECNVVKRRACEGCNDNCYSCAWAFPEKSGGAVKIKIPSEIYQELKRMTSGDAVKIENLIINILEEKLK